MKKKALAILLVAASLCSLVACTNAKDANVQKTTEVPQTQEQKLDNEIDKKIDEINEMLENHAELWNKALEGSTNESGTIGEGASYGQILAKGLESNRSRFSEAELKDLESDLEKINQLEKEIEELNKEYSQLSQSSSTSSSAFPVFKGKTFEGDDLDNDRFKRNSVTVVNFWFNGCNACIAELKKLDDLNNDLKAKGGEVVGINTDAFDGKEKAIEEAKKILTGKGTSYTNAWISSNCDLAKNASQFSGYPITFVIDRNGNTVGEPILGGIDNQAVMEILQNRINEALK